MLGNARHVAKKPSASPWQRKSRNRRNNFTAEIENPKSEEKAASLKRGGNFLVVFSRAQSSSSYLI
jgi:hypothetical protein